MSPRPGERAGWLAAERGEGKVEAVVLGRGLPVGPPAAPLATHFARLPTSRRWRRPRSAPRACPRPAGAGAREGGGRRREEEAARVGEEAAPRPAARRHLRRGHQPSCAARTRRLLGAAAVPAAVATVAGLAACAGRSLLGPGSRGSSLILVFPPFLSLNGDGRWRWARGARKFALLPWGPWRAGSAAEQVTPGSRALGNF